MKSFPRNGNPRASINAAINGAWFSVPMQIAPGRGATLFSIPAFDTLASAINSIWVRHARRRGTGREQPLGQLCRIMLQCILVAVSHSFLFFWAKIESRPNCVNFTPHFSNCFAARSRPALPFPPLFQLPCMFVGTFSAWNQEEQSPSSPLPGSTCACRRHNCLPYNLYKLSPERVAPPPPVQQPAKTTQRRSPKQSQSLFGVH